MPELTSPAWVLILWTALGYLLGSVAFGMVIAKLYGLGDLRKIGSGNIGATNVLRTGHKFGALMTLLLDSGKGAIAVLLARWLAGDDAAQLAGGAAMVGHCLPVWLRFHGGKGVATYFGTMLALAWPVGLAAAATWLAVAAVTRYSSLAALTAVGLAPVWGWLLGRGEIFVMGLIVAALIFYRHRENIRRLTSGSETRIGQKAKQASEAATTEAR